LGETVLVGPAGIEFGNEGSAPSPFDALNGPQLAGPLGSHPLHAIRPEQLVRQTDGAVSGSITLDRPARVGDGITGHLAFTANDSIDARTAHLRLVGLRLDEIREAGGDRHTSESESRVAARGRLFSADAFLEPSIPAVLKPGQSLESPFSIPAPSLGPPTAHLGESIIACAIEVRWDIPLGTDHFIAAYVPLAQNPDLLAAGVGKQGGLSLEPCVAVGDATISVTSPLPAASGSQISVSVAWPSAPSGENARIELHRRTNAPNGLEEVLAWANLDPALLRNGSAQVELLVPSGLAPTFDGAGLQLDYVIRVLVDRTLRLDAAVERPVGII